MGQVPCHLCCRPSDDKCAVEDGGISDHFSRVEVGVDDSGQEVVADVSPQSAQVDPAAVDSPIAGAVARQLPSVRSDGEVLQSHPSVEGSLHKELSGDDKLLLGDLENAADPSRKWFHKALIGWHELPVGDKCAGEPLLRLVATISDVYPMVFHRAFAVRHLTSDLKLQVGGARKHWPQGALTLREAVRAEVSEIGVQTIEERYWNTCTVRIVWVYRAMRILAVILEDLACSEMNPVQCAQHSVELVLGPFMNWGLKHIADFIIRLCVYKQRSKLVSNMQMPENEVDKCLKLFFTLLRPHTDALESMLKEEVPSVFSRKPP
mmetsp:Transcript_7460/g.17679  ORF Transcript_7460/g.17679 Transcript_7460/m.17679 type:complete len:321 (-) Transcript_7460:235-1197(-)